MQKFSKKLVSKCIYIHILCASTPELLELFLTQKGWDLLNAWFSDAYSSQNYYLCTDLVKLFAVCPMTSARLKENVEINQVNISFFSSQNIHELVSVRDHWPTLLCIILILSCQAPKLIRLLSTDENISMDVRNAALQVTPQHMTSQSWRTILGKTTFLHCNCPLILPAMFSFHVLFAEL